MDYRDFFSEFLLSESRILSHGFSARVTTTPIFAMQIQLPDWGLHKAWAVWFVLFFFFFKQKKNKKTLDFPIQIKTTVRCHFTLLGMLLLKSQEVTTVGKNMEK